MISVLAFFSKDKKGGIRAPMRADSAFKRVFIDEMYEFLLEETTPAAIEQ